MQAGVDEIIEQVISLKPDDRRKVIQALQEAESKTKTNGAKGFVHPNTVWIKEHHAEYAGKHIALKGGELIAFGDTIKEADVKAKKKGVEKFLLTYLPREDEELWGGW